MSFLFSFIHIINFQNYRYTKKHKNSLIAMILFFEQESTFCANDITFFPYSPLVYLTTFSFYFYCYWKIYLRLLRLKICFCALICCHGTPEGHQNLAEVVYPVRPDASCCVLTLMRQLKTRFDLMLQNPGIQNVRIIFKG